MRRDPHRIELEVTEGVLLDDSDTVREALSTLREAGFKIALDDFGTGYSSLSYLRRFEVDKIKIDRSFVQHLGHAVDWQRSYPPFYAWSCHGFERYS